ncbi:hypothetical protein J4Q44_G00048050 [Coregonus suidteri]|uniref:Uncharacterized protein n=1 Tax=Coregonus suidteri TaxID=861788 RepID=A0AAN8MEP9_9TELE
MKPLIYFPRVRLTCGNHFYVSACSLKEFASCSCRLPVIALANASWHWLTKLPLTSFILDAGT